MNKLIRIMSMCYKCQNMTTVAGKQVNSAQTISAFSQLGPGTRAPIEKTCALFKGTYRDHRVTGALNFHKIRDFCILVMVLDV